FIDKVPVDRVQEFESEFLERLTLRHEAVLDAIRETGTLSDEAREVFEKEAKDLAELYVE
ncbi:MAG: F0F1 ATP synthase subunit alpha, partial [Bacteroidetes bacterium]|nr:F0F1 ATP synthase subunit alpha [Bacteroidota bacterium]